MHALNNEMDMSQLWVKGRMLLFRVIFFECQVNKEWTS